MSFRGESPRTELGLAIRAIRRRIDLNQKEFAALTGFNVSLLSWYETGRAKPSAQRLIQILRMARTSAERKPLLKALAAYGVLAPDLAPIVVTPGEESMAPTPMLPVSSGADQTAISEVLERSDA